MTRPDVPLLFRLAHVAIGDVDRAAAVVADVLLTAPPQPATAIRQLIAGLPADRLTWPGEARPAEWLALRLRPLQADRLLSMLGEWTPVDRIAVALHLLEHVHPDDLDGWIGTWGYGERVRTLIESTAGYLGVLAPSGVELACQVVAADLLDADDPQVGRRVRRHTVGCAACQARVHALQHARHVLRRALQVFFHAPVPSTLPCLIAVRRQVAANRRPTWRRPATIALVVLLCYSALHGPIAEAVPPSGPVAPPVSATALLDQALHRFDAPPLRTGVLHERFVSGSGPKTLLLERWYDYHPPYRLRITLRQPSRPAPLLDLVVLGPDRLAFTLQASEAPHTTGRVETAAVAAYLPILAQLPATGAFGMQAVPEPSLDVELLAQARHGRPTLLGQTHWHGRPAYLISTRAHAAGRYVLTLDRATLSLLDVRVIEGAGSSGVSRQLWEATLVEVHAAADVPAAQFALPEGPLLAAVNPRQLFRGVLAPLDVATSNRMERLPLPEALPAPVLLAYAHREGLGRYAEVQHVYESRWSTLIVAPASAVRDRPVAELDRQFRYGAYRIGETTLPQTTLIEFAFQAAPQRRMRLYLWHALATHAEREALAGAIVEQLSLPDAVSITRAQARFLAPDAGTAAPRGEAESVEVVTAAATTAPVDR